jgi:hypothetical protein
MKFWKNWRSNGRVHELNWIWWTLREISRSAKGFNHSKWFWEVSWVNPWC